MNVVKELRNELLKRKEIEALGEYGSNPGFETVKKDVAGHFKASEDSVVVKSVHGHFGSSQYLIDAMVYDSADLKDKIEPKKKEKKK